MSRNEPTIEIEITDDMIAAGVKEFRDYSEKYDPVETAVQCIFFEMYRVYQSKISKSDSSDLGNLRETSAADK